MPSRTLFITFLLLFCCFHKLTAQDSTWTITHADSVDIAAHKLQPSTVAVAAGLTGISAIAVENGWLRKIKGKIHDRLSAHGGKFLKIDDYLQYVHVLEVYGFSAAGLKATHNIGQRTAILAMSWTCMGLLVNGMKYTFREKRPDSNARNSFPSGHTATAFMGAEMLYQEYRGVSPWIGYSAYIVAGVTGYLRVYNDRHYINDVIAGACVGVLSTKFSYWLYPRLFKRTSCGKRYRAMALPYINSNGGGIALTYSL